MIQNKKSEYGIKKVSIPQAVENVTHGYVNRDVYIETAIEKAGNMDVSLNSRVPLEDRETIADYICEEMEIGNVEELAAYYMNLIMEYRSERE